MSRKDLLRCEQEIPSRLLAASRLLNPKPDFRLPQQSSRTHSIYCSSLTNQTIPSVIGISKLGIRKWNSPQGEADAWLGCIEKSQGSWCFRGEFNK